MELIKNNEQVTDMDVVALREAFVTDYCRDKNWDKSNLSFEQITEIRNHRYWKNPALLYS